MSQNRKPETIRYKIELIKIKLKLFWTLFRSFDK
jgi:hypothetical protein